MPKLPFVYRSEWGARAPKYQEKLQPPLELVAFHCAGKKECLDRESCKKAVKKMQDKHVCAYGLPDILYNFLIGGDGAIYEGRGWDILASKYPHTHFDGKVLDVAYIGPYKIPSKMPPEIMMDAAANLIRLGKVKNILLEDCLRSDLDLQTDRDPYYEGSDADGIVDEISDLDVEDMVAAKDLEDLQANLSQPPPTPQDVLGTQTHDAYSDVDEQEEEDVDLDTDDISDSEIFNPENDDGVYEM